MEAPVPSVEAADAFSTASAGAAADEWLIRRNRRGGAIASLLGERYLRLGTPRPVREIIAADSARARDVPAPRVIAAVVYPAGMFYSADIATEFVHDAVTLAGLAFDDRVEGDVDDAHREADLDSTAARRDRSRPAAHRTAAWRATGALVARAAAAGILHADLNLGNVLIQPAHAEAYSPDSDVSALMIDLDQCAVRPPARGAAAGRRAARMAARLHRSRRKLEGIRGKRVPAEDVAAFDDALRSALAARS